MDNPEDYKEMRCIRIENLQYADETVLLASRGRNGASAAVNGEADLKLNRKKFPLWQ